MSGEVQEQEHELLTLADFTFEDSKETITLKIQQVIEGDYGLYMWDSSKVLAEYLWQKRSQFSGCRVLELGAGTGLPGILLAASGANVVLTDRHNGLRVLENLRSSVITNNPVHWKRNGIEVPSFIQASVIGFSWGLFNSQILSLEPFDVIVGADLFYDNIGDYENILASVIYFLRQKPGAKFYTTYHVRNSTEKLFSLLPKWNLKSQIVPLSSSIFEKYQVTASIQLIEICLA
eukprot:TRINITY_DN9259_c0_g1_i1.p1 TRINITY_DN9259_c0_g1~~TRINITY_DN9259_c0_g1_i1.p1  ORF type:complete len:234 (-),score=28.58 TRINITY_DN9259_c0_g1_i1:58-759(-)